MREAGEDLGDYDDINTAQEKKLGRIVKERYGTDFFSVHRCPPPPPLSHSSSRNPTIVITLSQVP